MIWIFVSLRCVVRSLLSNKVLFAGFLVLRRVFAYIELLAPFPWLWDIHSIASVYFAFDSRAYNWSCVCFCLDRQREMTISSGRWRSWWLILLLKLVMAYGLVATMAAIYICCVMLSDYSVCKFRIRCLIFIMQPLSHLAIFFDYTENRSMWDFWFHHISIWWSYNRRIICLPWINTNMMLK